MTFFAETGLSLLCSSPLITHSKSRKKIWKAVPSSSVRLSEYQAFNHVLLVDQLASQQSDIVVASPTDVSQKVRHRELSTHCESIYSFSPSLQSISSFKVQIRNTDVFSEKLSRFSFSKAS